MMLAADLQDCHLKGLSHMPIDRFVPEKLGQNGKENEDEDEKHKYQDWENIEDKA